MEMREGLDLGYNPNPTTLVAILGNPWFTNRYVYWCFSILLLSWPLRVIIEYKTQYADYQVRGIDLSELSKKNRLDSITRSLSGQLLAGINM